MSGNNSQRLLEGDVMDPPRDDAELNRQRELNRTLTRELHDTLEENERLRKRVAVADAPIARLREKLQPFYQLLQALFGDIEEIAPEETRGATVGNHKSEVWESWKLKLNGPPADVIDALLKHESANATQLKIICKRDIKTIYSAISRLKTAGLIEKIGGRFSLRKL